MRPGSMKSLTSSSTARATWQAGRIASKSRSLLRMIILERPAMLEPALEAALFQEAIVVAHQQMRLHLPHCIQHDTDKNEDTGAAKERRHFVRHLHEAIKQVGNDCNNRQEHCAGEGDSAHGVVKIIARGLARTNARDVAAVLFQVVRNLDFIELGGDPEIREEENHRTVEREVSERSRLQRIGNRNQKWQIQALS